MKRVKTETRKAYQEELQKIIGQKGVTNFAESIGVKRDDVNNWLSGKCDIRLSDLITISKEYNVSVDYLLGLAKNKSPDTSVQGASDITGLSNESVKTLNDIKDLSPDIIKVLDILISDFRTPYTEALKISDDPKAILSHLYAYFAFKGLSSHYKYHHGDIIPDDPVSHRDDDLKITSSVIENAMLMDIQHSLISIKHRLQGGEE